jgi:hypothetical protein
MCHYVSQECSIDINKKEKGFIPYNQHHGTIFMKKHILSKHPAILHKWNSANLSLATKDQDWEKVRQKIIVGYGAIIDHFGSTTPYRKDDVGQKQFMEDLLFVAKTYMHVSIMENQWLQ